MSKKAPAQPSRRQMLIRSGLGLGGLATLSMPPLAEAAKSSAKPAASTRWDHQADVVCVGSGAAAGTAAVTAAGAGATVIVVEKMPMAGGTTGKSGGVAWIPNHPFLAAQGLKDERADCLRFMARYAYALQYDPDSPTLGLAPTAYRQLEAFYDNGRPMIEHMDKLGAVRFQQFTMWHVNKLAPDYADHLPENKTPRGRAIEPAVGAGGSSGGGSLAGALEKWLTDRKVPVLLEHRVTRLIKEGDRVIGVEADFNGKMVRIKAKKAVIFGTGGYAHNTDLIRKHQLGLYGSCARPGATGDFIAIAETAGAALGPMSNAWRTQVVLEEALENRALGLAAFVLPGDSMILVNKYGRRIVNEKINYNDRTETHFAFDPLRKEYPNFLQFMIFDERTLDAFGGDYPLPADRRSARHLISGATLAELAGNISARLQKIAAKTGGYALAPGFAENLAETIARFNAAARNGVDPDFDRGRYAYDADWQGVFSPMRQGTSQAPNTLPNITMHPFTDNGPYHAFILGPGALDTHGGPQIDEHAQVLDPTGKPIPGLYGAGNCIASPTGRAYMGAGGTIGPAMTFGYIAARHAL
ncbi:MAG: FAD-dependent oxidoreductase, partial [Azonexus sp.]|nr:FAD-dependent oxidoreductase [Azonexus sp.]